MRGHRVPRIRSGLGWSSDQGILSFEAAVEEPFRPAAGVVLLRSEAEEEGQLRIRVAVEVHLALLVAVAHRQSLHKVRVRRLVFASRCGCGSCLR